MDLPCRHFLGRRKADFYYCALLGGFRGSLNEDGEYVPEGVSGNSEVRVRHLPPHYISANRGEYLDVCVSNVQDSVKVYVQMKDEMGKINMLDFQMNEHYSKHHSAVLRNPSKGELCAVFVQAERKWCRGAVMSRPDTSKVKVYLVDIGSVEIVTKDELRKLLPQFTVFPPFAIRIMIIGLRDIVKPEILSQVLAQKEGIIQMVSCTGIAHSATFMVKDGPKEYKPVTQTLLDSMTERRVTEVRGLGASEKTGAGDGIVVRKGEYPF